MNKVFISVEGQTEETFVNEILAPYFAPRNLYLTPVLLKTRRMPNAPDFRGGILTYNRTKKELQRLLGDSSITAVTTMYDFYGLPNNYPGLDTLPRDVSTDEIVQHLEQSFSNDIGDPRFHPYFQLHEFEAFLFVDPEKTNDLLFGDDSELQELRNICSRFSSPEEIDDGVNSAPSKRIERIYPRYQKVLEGPLVVQGVGLEKIRAVCSHFDKWLSWLESLV